MVLCSTSASTDSGLRAVRQVNPGRTRICLSFNMFEDQTTATLRWSSPAEQRQILGDLALAYHKNLSVDTLFFVDLSDRLSWSWLLWRDDLKCVLGVCQYFCSCYTLCVHMGACACACVCIEISALGVVCQELVISYFMTGSLIGPELTDLTSPADKQVPGILLSQLRQLWGYRCAPPPLDY